MRWPEIYKLNRRRPQPGAPTGLRDPDVIHPGWVLRLPAPHATLPHPATGLATTTVNRRPADPLQRGNERPDPAPQTRPRPRLTTAPVGLIVIETTSDGVRSARRTTQDSHWVIAEGVIGGMADQAPLVVDRAGAEAAAHKLGFNLPSEPELHAWMWG